VQQVLKDLKVQQVQQDHKVSKGLMEMLALQDRQVEEELQGPKGQQEHQVLQDLQILD
jgi:hypothetical protein